MARSILAAAAALVLSWGPAHAATDPALESLVLQALIGALAFAGLTFRHPLSRFLSRLLRRKDASGAVPHDGEAR